MHLMPDQSKVVEERGGGPTEKTYTVHIGRGQIESLLYILYVTFIPSTEMPHKFVAI